MNKTRNQSKADVAGSDEEQLARRMRSQDIFQRHKEVVIEHADQEYRLRITRQNKLILTK